jgi:outer membrane immunogenic protein
MRKVFLPIALISFAASIPLSAVAANWQGPYAGAFVGGAFGSNHISSGAGTVTSTSYFATTADVNAVNNAGSYSKNPDTAILGVVAGHDWAREHLVFGVAVDYSAMPLNSSKKTNGLTYPDSTDIFAVSTTISTNWLFTLRGRIGYQTVWRWPSLLYLTGGMAITQLKINNSFSDRSSLAGNGSSQQSSNQIGWTGGAGLEVASCDHMTVNLEYLYIQVPSVNSSASITNTNAGFGIPARSLTSNLSTSGQFHAGLLTIGINYRFDE